MEKADSYIPFVLLSLAGRSCCFGFLLAAPCPAITPLLPSPPRLSAHAPRQAELFRRFPPISLHAEEQTDGLWHSLPPCPPAGKLQQQEPVLRQSRAGSAVRWFWGKVLWAAALGLFPPCSALLLRCSLAPCMEIGFRDGAGGKAGCDEAPSEERAQRCHRTRRRHGLSSGDYRAARESSCARAPDGNEVRSHSSSGGCSNIQ